MNHKRDRQPLIDFEWSSSFELFLPFLSLHFTFFFIFSGPEGQIVAKEVNFKRDSSSSLLGLLLSNSRFRKERERERQDEDSEFRDEEEKVHAMKATDSLTSLLRIIPLVLGLLTPLLR